MDDLYILISALDKNHEENDLHDTAKRRLENHTKNFGDLPRQLLTSEADQVCCRDHADVSRDENPQLMRPLLFWFRSINEMKYYRSDCKWPEDVRPRGNTIPAPPADAEEVKWVEPAATTFAVGLNVWCDGISVVVGLIAVTSLHLILLLHFLHRSVAVVVVLWLRSFTLKEAEVTSPFGFGLAILPVARVGLRSGRHRGEVS